MGADLVVRDCHVVMPQGIVKGGVAVSDGKITKITSNEALPSADRVIDGKGRHLFPGIIDIHVHFREPGYEYKEDFSTGSMAAAAGGVTAVFDMPSGIPYIDSAENLRKKLRLVEGRSYVDYGQYCMIADYNLDELGEMVRIGAIGFKLYMSKTAVKVSVPNDGTILEAFRRLAEIGCPTCVHAENDDIITFCMERMREKGTNDIQSYAEARPWIAEVEAIHRAALFSSHAGNRIHILHLSSRQGLEQIRLAKNRGLALTVETCPHYLLLSSEHLKKLGSIAKINPPIRSEADRLALWSGVKDGGIDIIATDHSPHTHEEKNVESVWDAAAGFAGVETSLTLMLTEVNRGRINLHRYVQMVCENPARLLGLYPRKGTIQVGSDADLVLVDMNGEGKISSENLKSKTKVTPFENWETKGLPIYTIVRGNIIAEEGTVQGKPLGQLLSHEGRGPTVPHYS